MSDPNAVDPREDNTGDEKVDPTATPGGVYDNPNDTSNDADDNDSEEVAE